MRSFSGASRVSSTLILLVLLTALPASAEQSSIPGAFADIGLGARIMGMGGAGSAGSQRAMDIVWNPAGLARLYRTEVTAMQTEQFGIIPSYFLAGARKMGPGLGLGVGILSSGDTLLRENTLVLGAGRTFAGESGFALGASVKLRHASFGPDGDSEGVDGSAWGAAIDLGVSGGKGPLKYGLVVEELLSDMNWSSSGKGSYHEGMPATCTAGFRLGARILELVGDLEIALDEERSHKAAVGAEWRPYSLLQIRGGMKQRLDAEAMRFFTLGAGLGHNLSTGGRLQIDCAYLFHELGSSLRVAASYGF